MKYKVVKGNKLFSIGIGTWGIGGFAQRDPDNDDTRQIDALAYMLDKGFNYIDICYWCSEGKACELLSKAIKESGKKRSDLFYVVAMYDYRYERLREFGQELDVVLSMFDTDYADSVMFLPSIFPKWGKKKAYGLLEKFLNEERTRYVSFSNASLDLLKDFKKNFGNKFFSHEVQLNFEVRVNIDEGIIQYANDNDILNVIYQPIRRNRTALRNWPLLVELSEKCSVTQNQIIMNWLVSKGYLSITKSKNKDHIDAHLDSLKLKLSKKDIERIDDFRPKGFNPKVDWKLSGKGVRIDQVSNIFDKEYDKQKK